MPVAATELIQFRSGAVEPDIPETVADLGLRGAPNFELLQLTRPELILISPFYTRYTGRLEAIAPVFSLPFYVKGEPPFEKALAAVTALGEKLGRAEEARKVLGETEAALHAMRARLAGFSARPTYVINIGDARHFRAFGADSMFGDVLGRLGLTNAWVDRSQFTFAAPVPLENLAASSDARIVIVSDIPVEARETLRNSAIWRALPAVRENRVVTLANVGPYGGITAGMRFARLLTEALLARGEAL
jgi:ABC-type Fe3+-hydroxamate transport system substrate-binding protein